MSLILDPDKSYTFRSYFELPFAQEDILAEFGVGLERRSLSFDALPTDTSLLRTELEADLGLVDLESEAARREILIAPVLTSLCRQVQARLKIEYPVAVNEQLKGSFDYYVQSRSNLLVVEAKNSDLMRGFTQLAVELIALDQWVKSATPVLYGAVTTGEEWRFGMFYRQEKKVVRDINLYRVPADLDVLMGILVSILQAQ
ncbi:hypothetical protein H6G00_01730 [Leptolyngbya sp. FACHB-541]|uniref:hypothetical protein n=1 Tax=Leptolyngbya sp. FACHB-541 TaxID=2692810 RepID=UPI001684C26D|nr:hypothetical protein [Leptolyngbya sp. FACHB-541]MBD1995351.1 hypothetical protein [Leptolyngbya sp. FACHB-541]